MLLPLARSVASPVRSAISKGNSPVKSLSLSRRSYERGTESTTITERKGNLEKLDRKGENWYSNSIDYFCSCCHGITHHKVHKITERVGKRRRQFIAAQVEILQVAQLSDGIGDVSSQLVAIQVESVEALQFNQRIPGDCLSNFVIKQ